MSSIEVNEQPELQFSVLRAGRKDPEGPFSEADLLHQMNAGDLTPDDLVFFEGMTRWQPIRDVFEIHEQISHFVDDGQDRIKVAEAFREVSNVVSKDENIYYIAVQEKSGLLSKSKICVIIADKHIFLLRDVKGARELEAHPWTHISNTLMRDEGRNLGTFSILLDLNRRVDVNHIPLKQVQRLFQLSQEMQEASERK